MPVPLWPQPRADCGVESEKMRKLVLMLKLLLLTVIAAAGAYYAIGSAQIGGLLNTDCNAADVIRERCPVHLVRPNWIVGKEQYDILFGWMIAEVKARLAVVCVFWILGVSFVVRQYLWKRPPPTTDN
jgi:hypothetical protein